MKESVWLKVILLLCLVIIPLTGCNFPSTPSPTQLPAEQIYTQAAETIVAQLTAVAQGNTAQPQLATHTSESQTEESTQVVLPSATETASVTPSPSLTFTPTLTPSPAPSYTPTVAVTDPRSFLGEPTWRDRFRSTDNWSLYEDDNVTFQIEGGQLVMVALQDNGWDSWMISWPDPDNFYLELSATPGECTGLDRYGLIFRTDALEGYLLGVSCDGRYSLRRWNGEKFSALIDWTSSPAILAGADQLNRLGVMVEGNHIKLFVNGQSLVEIVDNSYDEGKFGVFVGSVNTENFRVIGSEISYWKLP